MPNQPPLPLPLSTKPKSYTPTQSSTAVIAQLPVEKTRIAYFRYLMYVERFEHERQYSTNKFTPLEGIPVTSMKFEQRTGARLNDLREHEDRLHLEGD